MKHRLKQLVKKLLRRENAVIMVSSECYVDTIDELTVSGWARNKEAPSHKCHLQLMSNGLVLGEAVADLPQGDLAKQGYEDGCYGYRILAQKHLFSSRVMSCYLICDGRKVQGSDMTLELTPEEYSDVKFQQTYSGQLAELEKLIESNTSRLHSIINDRSFDSGDDSLNVAVGVLIQEVAVVSSRLTVLENYLVNSEKKF